MESTRSEDRRSMKSVEELAEEHSRRICHDDPLWYIAKTAFIAGYKAAKEQLQQFHADDDLTIKENV